MKTRFFLTAAAISAALMVAAAAQTTPPASDSNSPNATVVYPAEVALSQEGGGFLYRRFPGSQRLYYYDKDKAAQSVCDLGCDGARTPVYAPASSKALGNNWTVIRRYDGTYQWVYKGHPLYTLYHDSPADPQGDGEGGVWHLLGFQPNP